MTDHFSQDAWDQIERLQDLKKGDLVTCRTAIRCALFTGENKLKIPGYFGTYECSSNEILMYVKDKNFDPGRYGKVLLTPNGKLIWIRFLDLANNFEW